MDGRPSTRISELIRKAGQKILPHPKIQVQNIVATSDLGSEVNLNSIAVTLGLDRVEYEPEQFPGLVCRLTTPRVVVLLFGSGKLVCTGARRPSDVELAVQTITTELRQAGLLAPERTAASGRDSTGILAAPSRSPAPRPRVRSVPSRNGILASE
ncbi:TATA-box binding protein [mine drainage metagenome]|uniref:TATA-box binding protein n=1 Tax=mine drainage metagenome TaxID=410659 RepID=T1BL04_9ZZZZ